MYNSINPCFICGKQPKVYQFSGGYCVQCKPLLKRTHWKVEAPTEEDAVKYWNERIVQFKDDTYNNIQ